MLDYSKLKLDKFLDGKINIYQPINGYKSGTDAILLASLLSNAKNKQINIAEIGCGVGVASIALLSRLENLNILGIEKNNYFYNICKVNIINNKFKNSTMDVVNLNILDLPNEYQNIFDAVMMNPPYFKNNISNFNLKNYGNIEEDAKIDDFISSGFKMLKNYGDLYIIYTSQRIQELLLCLKQNHWGSVEIFPIYSYANKSATRFLLKAKKLSKGVSKIHFGIIMHNDDKSYTIDAQDILKKGLSFKI